MSAHVWRGIGLAIVIPLTCLLIVASTLVIWAHQTLLDTDRWEATTTLLLKDPRIVDPLSAYLAGQIVAALQIQARAEQALPDRAQFLAAPLAAATSQLVQAQTQKLLESDAGQQAWASANRRAHDRLVSALRGDSQALNTANGMVTLDLLTLTAAVLQQVDVGAPGLLQRRGAIPNSTTGLSSEALRGNLAQAIGTSIPPDFGQVPLFPAEQLAAAQRGLRAFDLLSIASPIIVLALVALAFVLGWNRWLIALLLAAGTTAAFALMLLLLPDILGIATAQVAGPVARDVATAVIQDVLGSLRTLLLAGAVVSGILTALAAVLWWTRRASRASEQAKLVRVP